MDCNFAQTKMEEAIYGRTKWITLKSGKRIRIDKRGMIHNSDHSFATRNVYEEYQEYLKRKL